jgi:hypothetical protein
MWSGIQKAKRNAKKLIAVMYLRFLGPSQSILSPPFGTLCVCLIYKIEDV